MVSQGILGVFGSIVLDIIILLNAHSLLRSDRLSRITEACSMHHHASASCTMSHAGNPRIFAYVGCFEILIRPIIVTAVNRVYSCIRIDLEEILNLVGYVVLYFA
jgi:hypothetical protein